MNRLYQRRNARLHEKILFSLPVQLLLGLLVVVGLPAVLAWGWQFWALTPPESIDAAVHLNTFVAAGLAFMLAALALHHLHPYPGAHLVSYIVPTATVIFLAAGAWLLMTRLPYSRPVLLSAWVLSLAWFYANHFVSIRFEHLRFGVVPFGLARELQGSWQMAVELIERPDLEGRQFDGIVADLAADDLGPEWERFLARCTLGGIPVYHVKQIQESITGRVRIRHIAENEFGSLLPSPLYLMFKRLVDVLAVLVTLPVTLPLMLLTALAIRLDSPGPALFVQTRIGQGNREFRMFKFRSMCADAECSGAQLAQTNDCRVTRVGRFIRKTRLDELPQFLNVLRGDMSLIGPRPEQRPFVNNFEEVIPFYSYRHVVKPGITGWAQVMQGYASDTDNSRIKLQYDLYYIKHFSLWLDILIIFKTIRTVVTGFGAK